VPFPPRSLALALAVSVAAIAALRLHGPVAKPSAPAAGSSDAGSSGAPGAAALPEAATAKSCAPCHEEAVRAWESSQHARAMHTFDPARDPHPPGAPAKPAAWIGVAPLAQVLLPGVRGRFQVFDPAHDAAKGEWFSIFGAAPPAPHEWGHWSRGGMTWNAQCAACHTTGFVKGYDAARDAYGSRMESLGVGCAACHGAMAAEHGRGARPSANAGAAKPSAASAEPTGHAASACRACHTRREELTGAARPGEPFDRHYRLRHADEPDLYAPDGQARGEVFEAGSLALSRMGHAGVTCGDCHEPHGGKLRVANDDDALCLGCHAPPTRRGATPIDAAAHAHHDRNSEGARCVSCHMPLVTVMGRDARRDHRFSSPNPRLARDLGLPLACDRCHGREAPTWAVTQVGRWFPRGSSARLSGDEARTRALAAASRGDLAAARLLADRVPSEPIDAWRATLLLAIAPFAGDAFVQNALVRGLDDASPDVRHAAIAPLARFSAYRERLVQLRDDPVLAVRLAAAWATRSTLPREGRLRDEVVAWIEANVDTPAGLLRASELAVVERRPLDAVSLASRATAWDPSVPTWMTLARALAAAGRRDEARTAIARAEAMASAPAPRPAKTP
jgi:predicted CXXCH cytochrome family protein